jgi:hypothetical protein
MIGFTDSQGTPLSGGGNYRVKLPPNIPAGNFWSVTLYEAENTSGLANGQPFPSLGSRDKPMQNTDGSTDLYLGPNAPKARPATGSRLCRARDTSRSFGSMAPPSDQQELEAGRHREGGVDIAPMAMSEVGTSRRVPF